MSEHGSLTSTSRRERSRERRERRRRRILTWVVWLLLPGIAFWVGLALGKALESTPEPGGTRTFVRTLEATTVSPSATVTVTVSNP